MGTLMGRISRFARSDQGRQAMEKAQRLARDPETRRKVAEARQRLGRKR